MTSSIPPSGHAQRRTRQLAVLTALVLVVSFGLGTTASADPSPASSPSASLGDPGPLSPNPSLSTTPTDEETGGSGDEVTSIPPSTPGAPQTTEPAPTAESPAGQSPAGQSPDPESPDPETPNPESPDPESPTAESPTARSPGPETPNPESPTAGPPRSEPSTGDPSPDPSAAPTNEPAGGAADLHARMLASLDPSDGAATAGITPSVVVSEDGNIFSLGIPGCAPVGGTAVLDQTVGYLDFSTVSQPESLVWEITGPGFSQTGSVTPTEEFAEFTVSGLEVGDYTLVYSNDGAVLLEDAFRVINCLSVTVSCAAISFTNPVTNPEVSVIFGGLVDDDFDDDLTEELTLTPGRTVTGYTGEATIGWIAYWADGLDVDLDQPGRIVRVSEAGTDLDVDIAQDGCAARILSVDGACVDAGDRAQVEVQIAKLEPLTLYYEIWAPEGVDPVADGEIAPGATRVGEDFTVPRAGPYEVRLYVERSFDPYDVVEFDVSACATSTPAPPADPNGADPNGADPNGSGAAPVSGGGALLADTGASAGSVGLVGVGLLLAAGVAMIIEGRRRQRG